MTDPTMALRALLEKSSDTELLREMVGFTAQRLMDLEAESLTGAPYGKRSEGRVNQRNGFRDRTWETRAGTIELRVPKLRIEFLRMLARRSLRGVKLVISDAHEGHKAAITKVLHATWAALPCNAMRNLLAHAGRQGRGVVAAFIGTAFAQEDAASAKA